MTDPTTAPAAFDHHRACQHNMYRLTCDEFDLLYHYAQGNCQLCGTPEAETKQGRLQIDHAPDYGLTAVRGLLCARCNTLMGHADRGNHLDGAIPYRHSAWFLRVVAVRRFLERYSR